MVVTVILERENENYIRAHAPATLRDEAFGKTREDALRSFYSVFFTFLALQLAESAISLGSVSTVTFVIVDKL